MFIIKMVEVYIPKHYNISLLFKIFQENNENNDKYNDYTKDYWNNIMSIFYDILERYNLNLVRFSVIMGINYDDFMRWTTDITNMKDKRSGKVYRAVNDFLLFFNYNKKYVKIGNIKKLELFNFEKRYTTKLIENIVKQSNISFSFLSNEDKTNSIFLTYPNNTSWRYIYNIKIYLIGIIFQEREKDRKKKINDKIISIIGESLYNEIFIN